LIFLQFLKKLESLKRNNFSDFKQVADMQTGLFCDECKFFKLKKEVEVL
jgi:hypothetical protein